MTSSVCTGSKTIHNPDKTGTRTKFKTVNYSEKKEVIKYKTVPVFDTWYTYQYEDWDHINTLFTNGQTILPKCPLTPTFNNSLFTYPRRYTSCYGGQKVILQITGSDEKRNIGRIVEKSIDTGALNYYEPNMVFEGNLNNSGGVNELKALPSSK